MSLNTSATQSQYLAHLEVDANALLQLAEEVARATGALLRDAYLSRAFKVTTKATPTDLVSEVDLAAEQLIRGMIGEVRPNDAILGEEGGSAGGSSGLRWVIDPLDGTVNFVFGIPQWCVSIACQDSQGRTLVGVIYDPIRDELWSARWDGDSLLNGERIEGSTRADLDTSLLATGFGYDAKVRELQGRIIADLLPRVRDIRRLGSAALDLAWTAAGRCDVYFEYGVKIWDIAAGGLICERAGLSLGELAPVPPMEFGLIAGPRSLVDQLLPLVSASS